MTSAISVMWRSLHNNQKKIEERSVASESRLIIKLDRCEEKHIEKDLWARSITQTVGELKGKLQGHAEAREDTKVLSETAGNHLEQIADSTQKTNEALCDMNEKLDALVEAEEGRV